MNSCVTHVSGPPVLNISDHAQIHEAREFNELLGIDRFYWTGQRGFQTHVFHRIDESSLFHLGSRLENRHKERVVPVVSIVAQLGRKSWYDLQWPCWKAQLGSMASFGICWMSVPVPGKRFCMWTTIRPFAEHFFVSHAHCVVHTKRVRRNVLAKMAAGHGGMSRRAIHCMGLSCRPPPSDPRKNV